VPQPVPVYVTHLTARPEAGEIRFQKDVYGRDSGPATRWASASAPTPDPP
jgi:murein L,D-transpeptidase YcbB/YkuD